LVFLHGGGTQYPRIMEGDLDFFPLLVMFGLERTERLAREKKPASFRARMTRTTLVIPVPPLLRQPEKAADLAGAWLSILVNLDRVLPGSHKSEEKTACVG
jgi:hypothetical protein